MGPGATALTRIPCFASCFASAFVKMAMPPLVVASGNSVAGFVRGGKLLLFVGSAGADELLATLEATARAAPVVKPAKTSRRVARESICVDPVPEGRKHG